jgi:hypothetical protein
VAINTERFLAPAIKGDVSGVAVTTLLALISVRRALDKLKGQANISEELQTLDELLKKLESQYDDLVGWSE